MKRGLLIPLERSPNADDFVNGTGPDLWISKVIQVVGTQPGELDWNPRFGCPLRNLRHQNNTPMLEAMAEVMIRDAFQRWLPSLLLRRLGFTREGRRLVITIHFNERTGTGAARFPTDLTTEVPVLIAG